ncbi:MAG: biotin--[acetyl-CoA-carboxylase] ligase [Prevotella sp.]
MTDHIKLIENDEVDSTNNFLRNYKGEVGERMTVALANFQTAGRGQGVNVWESERGKNLTFSIKCSPKSLPVARQFVMLEAGALAIRDALKEYVDDITIKWPNDVYYRDYKISGTLSECSVTSVGVRDCILGMGININQSNFVGDAPNPISLLLALGHETDRMKVLRNVIERFDFYLKMVDEGHYDEIDSLYKSALYRRIGFFTFEDDGGLFEAEVHDVLRNGHLVLRRRDGLLSEYAFKEVRYLLN